MSVTSSRFDPASIVRVSDAWAVVAPELPPDRGLLVDVSDWLAAIDLKHAPDHNTLWRAFGALITTRKVQRVLDWVDLKGFQTLVAAVVQNVVVRWRTNLPGKRDECRFLMTDPNGSAHQLSKL
jgi:hypothetical protein